MEPVKQSSLSIARCERVVKHHAAATCSLVSPASNAAREALISAKLRSA
jgi:hypothetical protein